MSLLLISLGVLVLCGGLAALAHGMPRLATALGVAGPVLACVLGLVPAVSVLAGGSGAQAALVWEMPLGTFAVGLDGLSALFLVPILGLSALAAVYGAEYLWPYRERKSLGLSWCFYDLLVASMVLVCLARNALLFLVAWEGMSLASFFLVAFESEKPEAREASWTYLVATHLGTAFLFPLFFLLGQGAGTLDFAAFGAGLGPAAAGVCFVLALVGFGTKAGIMPFHVWLPEAHPAAPSHVSAVMSGVMIKTGIYGLVRTLTFLGPPPMWWGWVLVGVGAVSGVLGVLFALAQHDLKRLLAYHSVENIGIIVMGIGVGMVGLSAGSVPLMVLGFGGGLLHVVNHALFKGLLFLGAGSVLHGTGTLEMDHLGGLMKRMRWTGVAFLVGAVAICGLPPFNGFVSEFLIYVGSLQGAAALGVGVAVPLLGVVAALGLIGGLATACFTKAFGIVFLGEPRSAHAEHAHEAGPAMRVPMAILAAGCLLGGVLGPWIVRALPPALGLVPLPPADVRAQMAVATLPLGYVTAAALGLIVLVGLLAWARRRLLAGRETGRTVTWDCGYAAPSSRMQYTASSFAQPITDLFRVFLRTRKHVKPPEGYFPSSASIATETPDVCREGAYRPVFAGLVWALSKLRGLQQGRVQLYVLYVVLTLVVLLLWKLL